MSPFTHRHFLWLGTVLCLAPVAQAQTFAQTVEAREKQWDKVNARPITQREFADAASNQLGFLGALREWRDTLRGSGKAPRRSFAGAPLGQKIGLSLGSVAPPMQGSGAGIAANWSAFEVGTTAQPQPLNEALARFDSLLTGDKVATPDQTQMTWLRARPIQEKNAEVELSLARGRRDMQAGQGEKWRDGTFQGAKARLALPANWSLRGELTREQLENQDEAATNWNVNATGPIAHPWGEAQATANWRDVESGYSTLNDTNSAVGQKSGDVQVVQDVAHGPLTGQMKVGASKREREEAAHTGDEIEARGARSEAQLRLAVTPNLGLLAGGSLQLDAARRALQDQTTPGETDPNAPAPLPDALASPSEARELAQQVGGDVGVEWKFTDSLSIAVTTGASRLRQRREAGELWNDGPAKDEDRRAVEVRHHHGAADFRVRLAQRARRDVLAPSTTPTQADISQWRIEAARRLVGSLRLRTIVDLANDAKNDQNAHRVEAQLQLARAARIDARYREGDLPQGLLSDEWSSVFGAPSGARQWGARFNAGSAASGAGLGLAVEYARNAGATPDTWRVGLQFK